MKPKHEFDLRNLGVRRWKLTVWLVTGLPVFRPLPPMLKLFSNELPLNSKNPKIKVVAYLRKAKDRIIKAGDGYPGIGQDTPFARVRETRRR